ncbi:hypothetical protein D3C80_1368600 [compost metagenome]
MRADGLNLPTDLFDVGPKLAGDGHIARRKTAAAQAFHLQDDLIGLVFLDRSVEIVQFRRV